MANGDRVCQATDCSASAWVDESWTALALESDIDITGDCRSLKWSGGEMHFRVLADCSAAPSPSPPRRSSLPWVKTCDTGWVPGNCEGGATQKITFDPGFTRKQCIQECKREVGMGKTEVYCCSSDWRTKGVADASSECILSKGVGGCC